MGNLKVVLDRIKDREEVASVFDDDDDDHENEEGEYENEEGDYENGALHGDDFSPDSSDDDKSYLPPKKRAKLSAILKKKRAALSGTPTLSTTLPASAPSSSAETVNLNPGKNLIESNFDFSRHDN